MNDDRAARLQAIAEEVATCTACPLHRGRTKAVPGEGPADAAIMFIGEGPGQREDELGRPFVGRSGDLLERWLAEIGLDRSQVFIGNVVKCFISPRVKIYTSEGYKPIKDIVLGELVLTHTGKFRPVTYIRPNDILPEGSEVVEIKIRPDSDYQSKGVRITVTPEHPFLINGKWTPASEIKAGDAIKVLGDRCEVCGKEFFVHYSRYDERTFGTCSPTCHNRRVMHSEETRAKVKSIMQKQYAEGLRDPIQLTQRANEKTRQLVAQGVAKVQHFTSEERRRGRIALAQNITAGDGKHPVGYGEFELAKLLDQLGEPYSHHFALPDSPYTYDFGFSNHNILIEVRGPGFNNQEARARARVKDELASKHGYLVVNLWWEQIIHQPNMVVGVLERLLRNHRDEYVYIDAVVGEVIHRETKRNFPLYNIGVEGDESFVVAGVVSHNCRPPGNRDPEPAEIAACAHFLDRQMAIIEPKLVATLGRHSMNKFFPGGKITKIHGIRGVKREGARVFLPLYHPAYVLRNDQAAPDAIADIRLIPRLLARLEQRLAEERAGGQQPPADGAPAAPEEPGPEQMSLFGG